MAGQINAIYHISDYRFKRSYLVEVSIEEVSAEFLCFPIDRLVVSQLLEVVGT